LSRSRRQQCSVGRGCPVCGDAGEVRRLREEIIREIDERELTAHPVIGARRARDSVSIEWTGDDGDGQ